MNKILILLSLLIAPSYLSANTIDPQRFDYGKFDQLRHNADLGSDSFIRHGFKVGMIDDVYYNQVFVCTLTEIDSGANHNIAITKVNDVINFYEYVDVYSEGVYKILSSGSLTLTNAEQDKVTYTDNLGGWIEVNANRKLTAQVKLKEPKLSVSKPIPCYRP